MLEKNSIVSISESDKKYTVMMKEAVGDIVKIDFQFEDVFYFGRIESMSSNGTMMVKVKGIYGAGSDYSDNDLA